MNKEYEPTLSSWRVSSNHHNIATTVKARDSKHAKNVAIAQNPKFEHKDTTAEKSWIKESMGQTK